MADKDIRRPKHRLIFEHIHQAIGNGQYTVGQKLPTDGQLVRKFGASRPTVARAMRDLEQAGLVERRPGSGSYVRAAAQTSLGALGLLIPGLGETEIFEPICGELARCCHRHNLSLLWGDSHPAGTGDREDQVWALCQRYIDQRVSGVFFAPTELSEGMDQLNIQIATALDQAGVAVVLLDRDVERFPRRSRFDLVGIDNFRAGYLQAQHMLELGCERVDYVVRSMSAPTGGLRIAGYQWALRTHGLDAEDAWVHHGDPSDLQFVRQIAAQSPEAILCANDITAANLMRHLIGLGVRIPEEIRVMGLDDVKYGQLLSVPLTTIRQPCREIGAAAVQAMIQRLENRDLPARDIMIDVQIVVRESCGSKLG